MATITIKKQIQGPPEKVFEYAADLHKAADRISGIRKLEVLTDGPIGVGTRWRETRMIFKKEATEEMEITAFEPPKSYSVGAESHGCRYLSDFRFHPNGEGTEVEWVFQAVPLTFMAKAMSVMMKPMMKSMTKMCEKDLDDLKAAVEGDLAASAPAT